jgi:hypothetical protein
VLSYDVLETFDIQLVQLLPEPGLSVLSIDSERIEHTRWATVRPRSRARRSKAASIPSEIRIGPQYFLNTASKLRIKLSLSDNLEEQGTEAADGGHAAAALTISSVRFR